MIKKFGCFLLIVCLLASSWPGIVAAEDLEQTPVPSPRDGTKNGTTYAPTEEVLKLEVPDCPGITRDIDASKLPPSIYPKPICEGSSSTNPGAGAPKGTYGIGIGAPSANTVFWLITKGKLYPINQGYGMTDYVKDNPSLIQAGGEYAYCSDYQVPGHCGVDIGTPVSTLVYTPVAGKVVCAGTGVALDPTIEPCVAFDSDIGAIGERGRFQIELDNGDMLLFGHMSKITVKPGDILKAGQPIGYTGSAGTGPHFHIEYRHSQNGTWVTYDPRDVMDIPIGGTTQTSVKTSALLEESKVAAAVTTTSTMQAFEQKYGFNPPDGQSDLDFAKDATDFGIERDLAIKYAPALNVDPEVVVWWTWAEANKHDSYSYSFCQHNLPDGTTEKIYTVDFNCPYTANGVLNWQLGYGQQFADDTNGPILREAFQKTHGDPNDAATVQQVGQQVLSKSGIAKTFPSQTIDQFLAGGNNSFATESNYWIYTLGRDPAISVYLLAKRLGILVNNGQLLRDTVRGWGDYYRDPAVWQLYSNIMNDVLVNWGIAPGSGNGDCVSSPNNTAGSCSTEPDALQGMSMAEFTEKINANMAVYKRIAACSGANVPWQMMAAIHLRETGLDPHFRDSPDPNNNGKGPWQLDPSSGIPDTVDPYDFESAGCVAAGLLQKTATSGPVGRALSQQMDPSNHDDEVSIKDAFFGYNGRAGFEGNVAKGCTEDTDGHADWNFDCSGYVMNNMDENHKDMCIGTDAGPFCDPTDGTWKIFYKLFNSTYGADGTLLVYGGLCNLTTGVVNGIAIPTKSNLSFGSHFFEMQADGHRHIGVDISNLPGYPVFAVADGDILFSGWDKIGGYYIFEHIAANAAGNTSERWIYYGHLAAEGLVSIGSRVKAGQQIASTGEHMVIHDGVLVQNGNQTAPHLHFDIRTSQSGAEDPTIHVNPCSLDQFKQAYPDMDCATWGSTGVAWK